MRMRSGVVLGLTVAVLSPSPRPRKLTLAHRLRPRVRWTLRVRWPRGTAPSKARGGSAARSAAQEREQTRRRMASSDNEARTLMDKFRQRNNSQSMVRSLCMPMRSTLTNQRPPSKKNADRFLSVCAQCGRAQTQNNVVDPFTRWSVLRASCPLTLRRCDRERSSEERGSPEQSRASWTRGTTR